MDEIRESYIYPKDISPEKALKYARWRQKRSTGVEILPALDMLRYWSNEVKKQRTHEAE